MSLEFAFKALPTLEKYRSGPLGKYMDGFCGWLSNQGFSRHTIRVHLVNISYLNDFLKGKKQQKTGVLLANDVESFFKAYPSLARNRGPYNQHDKRIQWALNRFVKYLKEIGKFESHSIHNVYQSILEDYLQWMSDYRHIAEGTLKIRRHSITQFLEWLGSKATHKGISKITPEVIERFYLVYAKTVGSSVRQSMQTALRTFFRFCLQKGIIQHPLHNAVPTLRTYKLATVPRGLSNDQALKILDCVNRKTDVGRRDYAILQLLYTYGVRGGQIRSLQFTDIQWTKKQILFKAAKRGKACLLPLTIDVGNSLLEYLQTSRPDYNYQEVFLTSKAPYHALNQSQVLSAMVRYYTIKAGIDIASKGTHAFRHCFATRMVQADQPLKSIADVLGHRYLSTTFIYTKVDFNALKQVALEWPQEVSK